MKVRFRVTRVSPVGIYPARWDVDLEIIRNNNDRIWRNVGMFASRSGATRYCKELNSKVLPVDQQ